MSLSSRVEKAKKLEFAHNPYEPGHYSTWGSQDSKDYGEKYYRVTLSHCKGRIYTPDKEKEITVLLTNCTKDDGKTIEKCPDCKFNKAVCKHSLGALYNAFKNKGKLISFFDDYESALKVSFSYEVYKVQSGKGHCWAIVKEWPAKKVLSAEKNIELMRGQEDDEGID